MKKCLLSQISHACPAYNSADSVDENRFPGHLDLHSADAHPLQHPAHLPGHPRRVLGRSAGVLH